MTKVKMPLVLNIKQTKPNPDPAWATGLSLIIGVLGTSVNILFGKRPWSSGYGRRLMFQRFEYKSRHCILDGHFSHLFVVKNVMCVRKDENK